MADDSLDVSKMKVKCGGKQRLMRDGCWDGKVQKMVDAQGGYVWYWRNVVLILVQWEQIR